MMMLYIVLRTVSGSGIHVLALLLMVLTKFVKSACSHIASKNNHNDLSIFSFYRI